MKKRLSTSLSETELDQLTNHLAALGPEAMTLERLDGGTTRMNRDQSTSENGS
tara:strand:- start:1037 stop:1195 length:159 start_codon:yes stop_codon:yes gene_type:complete